MISDEEKRRVEWQRSAQWRGGMPAAVAVAGDGGPGSREFNHQNNVGERMHHAINPNINPLYAHDNNGYLDPRLLQQQQQQRMHYQRSNVEGRNIARPSSPQRYSNSTNVVYPQQPSTPLIQPTPTSSSTLSLTQQQQQQRKRIKSILFLSALSFMGLLVLDGLIQFTDLSQRVDKRVHEIDRAVHDTVDNAADIIDGYERRLVDEMMTVQQQYQQSQGGGHGEKLLLQQQQQMGGTTMQEDMSEREGVAGKFLRRLADYLLDDEEENNVSDMADAAAPQHRSYGSDVEQDADGLLLSPSSTSINEANEEETINVSTTTYVEPRTLHTLPLLPKHALQNRQRRELISRQLPIPTHLQEGVEDELYHGEHSQRRRRMMFPIDNEENVDGRMLVQGEESKGDDVKYETGALYQGYGTHYLDLWVGSPPQRQTVIIDTGSSITAFPCSGCKNCGSNPTTGEQYHLDTDFDTHASSSYQGKNCARGKHVKGGVHGQIPCDLGTCTRVPPSELQGEGNNSNRPEERCQLSVSYAEGSSWTALEGSDIVYPAGPHDVALEGHEAQLEAGVGSGMGSFGSDANDETKEFDWMEFRLKFGCQKKVTGLFQTQLEDGIMGMDNRKGAFWRQLHEHYKQHGYTAPSASSDGAASVSAPFDPTQFSLCYDRQPLSIDLTPGVGSGALTLGGTDPLLHHTEIVYAENVTPKGGWYSVRIKAMFLRTKGGTLSEQYQDAQAVEYVRVNVSEDVMNGSSNKNKGVIVDSGTTDTYLPDGLRAAFDAAWGIAMAGTTESKYHNNLRQMTAEEVKAMPTILLVLKGHGQSNKNNNNAIGMTASHEAMFSSNDPSAILKTDVVVAIPPTHYMEESHKEPGKFTSRVYFTEKYGSQSILGQNFLMGHEVNFDNGRGRIGFAESHCDFSRYIQEREDAKKQQGQQQQAGEVATTRVAQTDLQGNQNHNIESDLAASGWSRRRI